MKYYAKIEKRLDGDRVVSVICADQPFIDTLNTEGFYYVETTNIEGVGYTYSGNTFVAPTIENPMPNDGNAYNWDEATTNWKEII
jgi:hypothetical protein